MFNWGANVEAPPPGTTRHPPAHGPLQWLPANLTRPLPNTLPPISALRPTGNFSSPAVHHDNSAVVQTPVSTDRSSSEGSPGIREHALSEAGAAVDLDPEPAYDHPAPGPEPSSDVELDASSSRNAAAVRANGGVPGRSAGVAAAAAAASAADLALLEGDIPRKHGKRLTTREETALFEICNRNAPTFGERNRLCEWWLNVTRQFIASQGHPYSWHSVRRKVELVTHQRMKFLASLDGKRGEDQSDSTWRNAVDSWIPVWKRFQEQESERVNAKQGKRGRKRKSTAPQDFDNNNNGSSHNAVQLPSGFDTMFTPSKRQALTGPSHSSGAPVAPSTSTSVSTSISAPMPTPTPAPATVTPTPMLAASSSPQDRDVSSAILDTLSKLNRNLEAASSRNPQATNQSVTFRPPAPNSSVTSPPNRPHVPNQSTAYPIAASAIMQIKWEVRNELRQEMEKHQAHVEDRLNSVQRTQDMILELLRQGPQ